MPIYLLGQDVLGTCHGRNSSSQKEELLLEFDSSQSGKLNDPSASFICSISDDTIAGSIVVVSASLYDQNPQLILAVFTVCFLSLLK